jgi:hypothetical protein
MKQIINELVRRIDNRDSLLLLKQLGILVDSIGTSVDAIEKWSGDAYQTGDEIYNAVDNIKSIVREQTIQISVYNMFQKMIEGEKEIIKEITDIMLDVTTKGFADKYLTICDLFEIYPTIPMIDDPQKAIIKNWGNLSNILIEDNVDKCYRGVKEEYKNIRLVWDNY